MPDLRGVRPGQLSRLLKVMVGSELPGSPSRAPSAFGGVRARVASTRTAQRHVLWLKCFRDIWRSLGHAEREHRGDRLKKNHSKASFDFGGGK